MRLGNKGIIELLFDQETKGLLRQSSKAMSHMDLKLITSKPISRILVNTATITGGTIYAGARYWTKESLRNLWRNILCNFRPSYTNM